MEEIFTMTASYVALGLETTAVVMIAIGAFEAVFRLIRPSRTDPDRPLANQREVWVRFAVWLILGLEFELGADIIRSAISPSWQQLGQLGAVAVIRTFLNFFLERDIEKYVEQRDDAVKGNENLA